LLGIWKKHRKQISEIIRRA